MPQEKYLFEYKVIYKVKKFKNHQQFIDRQRPTYKFKISLIYLVRLSNQYGQYNLVRRYLSAFITGERTLRTVYLETNVPLRPDSVHGNLLSVEEEGAGIGSPAPLALLRQVRAARTTAACSCEGAKQCYAQIRNFTFQDPDPQPE